MRRKYSQDPFTVEMKKTLTKEQTNASAFPKQVSKFPLLIR
jgi:hypothetical protein